LKGDSAHRPTAQQILDHRFLALPPLLATIPKAMPMQFYAFMSHAQADASGTTGTLYFAYKQLGLHNWLDMRQANITLEAMRQGVQDSRIFLLVLTQHVLASWYCQQEMLTAIELEKPVQLVIEEEERFHPFSVAEWRHHRPDCISVKNVSGQSVVVPPKICALIDRNLQNAVTYRRRDFEVDSMIRELCYRNGLLLPPKIKPQDRVTKTVFVINSETAHPMLSSMRVYMKSSGYLHFSKDINAADCVLLLLTQNVLHPPSIHVLEQGIAIDKDMSRDRITAVYDESAGWRFGSNEHTEASAAVQSCLNEHEAICFRHPDPDGPKRHEFAAMMEHLLDCMCRN
jgi:hypothetical protein